METEITRIHYKVVTGQMQSLGLRRNPNIMTFTESQWIYEINPQEGNSDYGGIWVARNIGGANTLKKYMLSRHNLNCLIFETQIGDILFENSYRIKTNRVFLIKKV